MFRPWNRWSFPLAHLKNKNYVLPLDLGASCWTFLRYWFLQHLVKSSCPELRYFLPMKHDNSFWDRSPGPNLVEMLDLNISDKEQRHDLYSNCHFWQFKLSFNSEELDWAMWLFSHYLAGCLSTSPWYQSTLYVEIAQLIFIEGSRAILTSDILVSTASVMTAVQFPIFAHFLPHC